MKRKIQFNDNLGDFILDSPVNCSDKGIFFVPGSSGDALSERFDFISKAFVDNGYHFLRFNCWEDADALGKMHLEEIHLKFNAAIDYLKIIGCKKIGVVGKSIGGGFLLTDYNKKVDAIALLAPAISFSKASNIEEIKKRKMKEINHYKDIKIDKNDLSKLDIPILLVWGDHDKVVSIDDLKEIANNLSKSSITMIHNADHSFRSEEEHKVIVEKLLAFFRKNL
jgi:pimeloyl-ACP methyl ester carboxylesterase